MNIAILGYGSLIWDLDTLAGHVSGPWRGGGPALPVEFSRISPKRQQALVLIVDERLGHACPTCFIRSSRTRLEEAVADLAARERCEPRFVHTARAGKAGEKPMARTVGKWLETNGFDAALWASLPGNFESVSGKPFSHASALAWLRGLEGTSLAEARRYIARAPRSTDTPLRRYLADKDW
jgi:hypothetical protein